MWRLLSALCLFQLTFATELIVPVEDGRLRGSTLKDINGNDFYSFQSIPYAEPPVGNLRFKDPKPPRKWADIRNATEEAPICLQKVFFLADKFVGFEDCLYLNVYTPDLLHLKPVIVFIHGGGFMEGSGIYSIYGPEFLVSQDVVLVTINYRVGILGFTSFDNPALDVPGNAGLKDQNLALKWIKNNIKSFGGDPSKVTLYGESAGGASVDLHILSPLSHGLFQRAIMQSGTSLVPWSDGEINNGVASAKALGFNGNDEVEMLEFLQHATKNQLEEASKNETLFATLDVQKRFGPIVERQSENAFLLDTPRNIIKNGNYNRNVDLLLGFTSVEGIILYISQTLRFQAYKPWTLENIIPHSYNLTSSQKSNLVQSMENFYNVKDISDPQSIFNATSDAYFVCPTYETIFGYLQHGIQSIYFYVFSSDSKLNYLKYINDAVTKYNGVAHTDDLWYFFKHAETSRSAFTPGSIENEAIKNSVKLFANFAKDGKPTSAEDIVQWRPVEIDTINYINITLDQNIPGKNIFEDRASFCCDTYKRYNQDHFCTW